MAKIELNDKAVRELPAPIAGNRIDYDAPKGPNDANFVRGFAVRTTAAGLKAFLLVYVSAEGRERRLKIGDFGPYTVSAARTRARDLRKEVDAGGDPFADGKVKRAKAEAKRALDTATFGGLLAAYVQQLRDEKKPSADKVESELHRTVRDAFAGLWKAPASDVGLDDLVRITSKLARAGKYRQAEKTRSYLCATYTANANSRGNPSTAHLFAPFQHVPNVARDLGTIKRPKVAATDESLLDLDSEVSEFGKRALSEVELGAYWRRIKALPPPHGALLQFHLLTGAQRCEQLARLEKKHYSREHNAVVLFDGKGRRQTPRKHAVPLLRPAREAMEAMEGEGGPFLFTLDGGKHGAVYHSVRALVKRVATAMVKAGEIAETFSPGELRVSVETRLTTTVSDADRAQLQSHGISGVQDRHYKVYNFLPEKLAALQKLFDMISAPPAQAKAATSKGRSKLNGG